MTVQNKTACIFGGSGFIGTQIIRELARLGYQVKVASRIPESAYFLKPAGSVGQVVPMACDYSPKSVHDIIKGCEVVVNCVGILFKKKKGDFTRIHSDLPAVIAKAAHKAKAKRFVHISALGVDHSSSKYAKSKLEGEAAVLKNYKKATILRPSVVFGENDDFFNMFARMAQILPALPLIGGGHTKFQPVFVGDVADAAIKAISLNGQHAESVQGKVFELGGPEILNFKEIYELLFEHIGFSRALVPLPFFAAKIQASFLSLLPKPLLTRDQVESLKSDNIVQKNALALDNLDISPTSLSLVLPNYLVQYRPGGRFGKTSAA